jgi:hypothetical protein
VILSMARATANGGVDLHPTRNLLCFIILSMISFLFWYQGDFFFPLLCSVLIGKGPRTNSLGDQIVNYLGSDSVCVFILGK